MVSYRSLGVGGLCRLQGLGLRDRTFGASGLGLGFCFLEEVGECEMWGVLLEDLTNSTPQAHKKNM